MPQAREHYRAHLREVRTRYDAALEAAGLRTALIGAGLPVGMHRDDQHHPYRADPLFLQWAPLTAHPGSCVIHRRGRTPILLVHEPADYWHQAAPVPAGPWSRAFDIRIIEDRAQIRRHLPQRSPGVALIGDPAQWRGVWQGGVTNPRPVLHHLDYWRALKTRWEVDCIVRATGPALAGHRAVLDGFRAGLSEQELGLVFLAATGQNETELPYPAIIAMNRNGATLHYQHRVRERLPRAERHSLLLDAGCTALGYASDITRTHAARRGEFSSLVQAMDQLQQRLCQRVRPGLPFPELQAAAHQALAELLAGSGLVRMEPEAMLKAGITGLFFPHGLGHLLGLQVHDVGGDLADPAGHRLPPPKRFPRTRLTRALEPGMVVTVEPGLYFIDSLLARLRAGPHRRRVDWGMVRRLRPCGGIRIEDNVLVTRNGHENLTRAVSGGF